MAALIGVPDEAFQGREVAVSPIFLQESYARIPEEVLMALTEQGVKVSDGSGGGAPSVPPESPATVYFTPLDTVGADSFLPARSLRHSRKAHGQSSQGGYLVEDDRRVPGNMRSRGGGAGRDP